MESQWRALYETIKAEITAGRLAPGAKLPTEHELSATHRVSRNTVRRAYLALSQDGAIHSVNGRGSFVMRANVTYEIDAVSRFRDVLQQQGAKSEAQRIESGMISADREIAARLEIDAGRPVLFHTAVILGDGVPFILTTRYFPGDLVFDFHEKLLRVGSFTRLLEDEHLGKLHRKSTTVGARLSDEREATLLACPRNAPLLDVVATGMLASGRIVEWQHAVMNSRLIKLSFRGGAGSHDQQLRDEGEGVGRRRSNGLRSQLF